MKHDVTYIFAVCELAVQFDTEDSHCEAILEVQYEALCYSYHAYAYNQYIIQQMHFVMQYIWHT